MTHTREDPGVTGTHSPPRRNRWRSPLKREIALALLLKLALLMGIKTMFFSHPIGKQEAAQRLSAMIDGNGVAAESSPPSYHFDKTEQK